MLRDTSQKQLYLSKLASIRLLGCFGLFSFLMHFYHHFAEFLLHCYELVFSSH